MEKNDLFKPKDLAAILGVSKETLRRWEKDGIIQCVKTDGGHRRYVYKPEPTAPKQKKIVYARVSSRKQASDLEHQVQHLTKLFPDYEVITDIGSGLNFKRKGLQTILEQLFNRNIQEVVVAHKDRLCRFGFDLFEFIFKKHGAILTVLERDKLKEPVSEFADDVMAIITVFSARYYGKRSYVRKEDPNLSNQRASRTFQPVRRRKQVLLQRRKLFHKRRAPESVSQAD